MKTIATALAERVGILGAAPNFAGLAEEAARRLAELGTVRDYEEGEYLFQQDRLADGFHVIVKGEVSVHRVGVDGRQQVLHVFEGRGELCGEVPVFEGSTYPAAAVATRTTRTFYLPRDALVSVGQQHPEMLLKMLATLSARLRRFVGLIDDLSLKDVSARLAKYLLGLAGSGDRDSVTLPTAKSVLASQLGTIPETLSRTLRKLQDAGIIDVKGGTISIQDEATLRDVANGIGAQDALGGF